MAKRFAIIFFIILASLILIFSSFLLVLFLAPGLRVFGVKYIAQDTHIVSINKSLSSISELSGFNGSVEIETYEIPIEVIFTGDTSVKDNIKIEFFDNFNGLTTSNIDDTTISFSKNSSGTAVLKVDEFKRFVYESSSSVRYLKLYIPQSFASSSNNISLTLKSASGDIKFSKTKEIDTDQNKLRAYFRNLKIETGGELSIDAEIGAGTYELTSASSISISSNERTNVMAENYHLTTTSNTAKVSVYMAVSGNLNITTVGGDIKFLSAGNLTVNTNYGNISCIKSGEKANVSGIVNIISNAGNIELGTVGGSGNNVIETTSGTVNINTIKNGTVTTQRGGIYIVNSNNLKISTNIGKVVVEVATEKIDIETKRGNVTLGGNNLRVNNPKVFSRLGNIEINSYYGDADVQTISGDIFIHCNNDAADEKKVTINCGGKLKAENLCGVVKINSSGDTDLGFSKLTGLVEINLADSVRKAKITALGNSVSGTKFYIEGREISVYEKNGETFNKVQTGTNVGSSADATIIIKGKQASIEVYFGPAAD